MARGKSGRIVLEIDPELKKQIYYSLEVNQQTMKEWFLKEANDLIEYSAESKKNNSKNKNQSKEI